MRHRDLFALVLLAVLVSLPLTAQSHDRIRHSVYSGRTRLDAELVVPSEGSAVKGAVVFVVGSGAGDFRDYIPGYLEHIVESIYLPRDIIVFYYNKRGVGDSRGNWKWGSIERRAVDTLAAVEYLRSLPNINPDAIGLVGHSQGAWVVQLAGSMDPRIAHVASLAGPAVTVVEHDLRRVQIDAESEGASGDAIEQAVEKRERAIRRMIFTGSWFPFFELRYVRNIFRYDPREAILGLTQPTLLAYGEFDNMAPADDSRARLDELFPEGDPAHLTFHTVAKADHFFRITDTIFPTFTDDEGNWIDKPYSVEFRSFFGNWLDTHVLGR